VDTQGIDQHSKSSQTRLWEETHGVEDLGLVGGEITHGAVAQAGRVVGAQVVVVRAAFYHRLVVLLVERVDDLPQRGAVAPA
jgi:hypothetical protein